MRVIFGKPGSKSLLTDCRRPKIVKNDVSRETFYKNCVKQKKCSDIAELLGNHQKNTKSSLKKFQKAFKQRKNREKLL